MLLFALASRLPPLHAEGTGMMDCAWCHVVGVPCSAGSRGVCWIRWAELIGTNCALNGWPNWLISRLIADLALLYSFFGWSILWFDLADRWSIGPLKLRWCGLDVTIFRLMYYVIWCIHFWLVLFSRWSCATTHIGYSHDETLDGANSSVLHTRFKLCKKLISQKVRTGRGLFGLREDTAYSAKIVYTNKLPPDDFNYTNSRRF